MTLCLNEFRIEAATQPLIFANQIILEIYFWVGSKIMRISIDSSSG